MKPHTHEGRTFTFSHLAPYTEVFARPATRDNAAEKFTVDIRFTDHCFTRSPAKDENYSLSEVYSISHTRKDFAKVRLFCPQRNEMSLLLPGILRSLPNRKPQHNKDHQNFFTIEDLQYQGRAVRYDIIFNVRKSGKGRLSMLVETAYVEEEGYGAARLEGRRIGFWIILNNTLKGLKIPT